MRVLFVQNLTYPHIGIMGLSSVLRRDGHETKMQFLNMRRIGSSDLQKIEGFNPDVIAIAVYTGWQKGVLGFCETVKNSIKAKIILGGPHPTNFTGIIADNSIDFICVGEGELSFSALVNRLQDKEPTDNIQGIWTKRDGIIVDNGFSPLPEMTELPIMDMGLYCDASKAIRMSENREFSLNRGCPYGCKYCHSESMLRNYGEKLVRSKLPKQAVDELRYVKEKYPFKAVFFSSDNFYHKRDFAFEFLDLYKREIDMPFSCQMRPEKIDNDIAKTMREAGCFMVSIGVESGSRRVRHEILGRRMEDETIISSCQILKENGLKLHIYSMVGIPGETYKEAWETVLFIARIKPTTSYATFFQPFPGTRITEELMSQGEISEDIFDRIPSNFFARSILPLKTRRKTSSMQRIFQVAVWYPEWIPVLKVFCYVGWPTLYNIVFFWTFLQYYRVMYKKKFSEAFLKALLNAFESIKA